MDCALINNLFLLHLLLFEVKFQLTLSFWTERTLCCISTKPEVNNSYDMSCKLKNGQSILERPKKKALQGNPCTKFVYNIKMKSNNSPMDQVFAQNGGCVSLQKAAKDKKNNKNKRRYAFLFRTGVHDVNVNVGYYTSVMGLGLSPTDTTISAVTCQNGDFDYTAGALDNFWRSAENFYTSPTETWNNDVSMLWAVSQASPLRSVHVNGDLQLYQYNYGCCAGYASGGFLANSVVTGNIYSGSQQQWVTRNTQMGGWQGGVWNMVFVGNTGNVPGTHCSNSGGSPYTTVAFTPTIAEKPFLYLNETSGKYFVIVPSPVYDELGPITEFTFANSKQIDFANVYVAQDTDSVATINSKLSQGLHLLLSPGIYNLTSSIVVTNANTVVLGIGFPTLVSINGNACITINSGIGGIRVAGILLQAGPVQSTTLFQFGTPPSSSRKNTEVRNSVAASNNPSFLYDIFARVGGTNDPSVYQVSTDIMLQINSPNVYVDNTWLWRADHGVSGNVYNEDNPCKVGLQVNGDNVTAYGLFVEHTLTNLVEWNGEYGSTYFYQSEFPYDVTSEYGTDGYVSYRVNNDVTHHAAYGVGAYSYFRDNTVYVNSGFQANLGSSDVGFVNAFTVFLNGNGGINHVVDTEGNSVSSANTLSYLC
ncbi:coagulation factor 5/8 type domain-containing protein [Reticulomyxa filosa]|uniref:Coagulation factor 5/8 type domain-containing protein n=1 Tax=Reticulomyxa filosa TaxID=46433 RepID=X6PAN7_RETFI|nr:coagulation factor 5/8 type domain-containing protein [Reticulomyxa filosa]|eukprot:ETO35216.1 coagulation factor 5/8 type domain-containing protein [Reticulomyxa filosa]